MKTAYGYIYKIVCLSNNKVYIGQTTRSIADRWKSHRNYSLSQKARTPLAKAIRKHGVHNFLIKSICSANNQKELDHREGVCIRLYRSNIASHGYNVAFGGRGGKMPNFIREKISLSNKGKRKPEGFGQKVRERCKGKPLSESTRIKLSISQKGEKHWFWGKKHSEKTKLKMSQNNYNKGRKKTREEIEKLTQKRGSKKFQVIDKKTQKIVWEGFSKNLCSKEIGISQPMISMCLSKKAISKKYMFIFI